MRTPPNRLLIIGDSIALGITSITIDDVRTVTDRNFVDRLRERMLDWQIDVDAAVRRTTTQAIGVLPELIQQHRPQVVAIFLGGNDVDINWKQFILTDGQRIRHNTLLERFESNLRRLISEACASGAAVVLSSLPEQNVMERGRQLSASTGRDVAAMLSAIGGETENRQRHRRYADVVLKVASEAGVTIVPWTSIVAKLPIEQRFGADGVHPGDAAHEIIADTLAELLQRPLPCQSPLAAARA